MTPRQHFQGTSPVLLSSSCTVLQNNSAIPNSGTLSYQFRKPILIDEIRFSMRLSSALLNPNLGSVVYTKLSLGQEYLMRDPVPVWLLCTLMNQDQEEGSTGVSDVSLAEPYAYSHYRWKLPEPMYVAAGQVLDSTFYRYNDGLDTASGTVTPGIVVQVSYVGRTVPPDRPLSKIIAIPYAAPFVTTIGQVYQQSNEKDLFNPFDAPIQMQRLTGRVQVPSDSNAQYPVQSLALTLNPASSGINILMNDSWGGKMVNNNTGPSDVFDAPRTNWTFDTVMPPKGIYVVRAWNIPVTTSLHVAMIGTREVSP